MPEELTKLRSKMCERALCRTQRQCHCVRIYVEGEVQCVCTYSDGSGYKLQTDIYWKAILYCTVLHCTVLYCTVLYCTVLYCTVLYCTVLYCTVLYCTALGGVGALEQPSGSVLHNASKVDLNVWYSVVLCSVV